MRAILLTGLILLTAGCAAGDERPQRGFRHGPPGRSGGYARMGEGGGGMRGRLFISPHMPPPPSPAHHTTSNAGGHAIAILSARIFATFAGNTASVSHKVTGVAYPPSALLLRELSLPLQRSAHRLPLSQIMPAYHIPPTPSASSKRLK